MTKRWKAAAAILAIAVFVYALVRPGDNPVSFLDGYPSVVAALFWASVTVVWVWFVEGVVAAIRR